MPGIRDSDSYPIDIDERFYDKRLKNDDGSCSCEKAGLETARHHRKIREIEIKDAGRDKRLDKIDRFIDGDETWPGAIKVLTSFHEQNTARYNNTALVKDPFWNNAKIILIFLGKVGVGLFAIAGLALSIIEAFR